MCDRAGPCCSGVCRDRHGSRPVGARRDTREHHCDGRIRVRRRVGCNRRHVDRRGRPSGRGRARSGVGRGQQRRLGPDRAVLESTPGPWSTIVGTNLLGTVRVTHAFLRHLIRNRGALVRIASEAGRIGGPAGRAAESVYAASKAGVVGFTKSIAREFARYGVRANCVSPGATNTDLFATQDAAVREAIIRSTPIRRMASPHEIAAAVTFFAGPKADFVTRQVLSVSGSMTMVD
jgi:NAD(P)-dependent dehydrogenase (short-subunit alcohol dehydrogenase family)